MVVGVESGRFALETRTEANPLEEFLLLGVHVPLLLLKLSVTDRTSPRWENPDQWKWATILITLGSLPAKAEDAPKYDICQHPDAFSRSLTCRPWVF
jgi:hypothetical protein